MLPAGQLLLTQLLSQAGQRQIQQALAVAAGS
jgi:hypothetical protein